MLAYRHAFHAGNHADVIKHAVMLYCLDYLQNKPSPVLVIDTHAGSGQYRVGEPLMRGKGEFNTGVLPLFEKKGDGVPPLIEAYLQEVRRLNTGARLERIPGSPLLLAERLRAKDLLHAFELHPSDFSHLGQALGGYGRRVKAHHANGFEAPKALLPNVSKRALVVIDPSYELRTDYAKAWACIKEILQLWRKSHRAFSRSYCRRSQALTRSRKFQSISNSLREGSEQTQAQSGSMLRSRVRSAWSMRPRSPHIRASSHSPSAHSISLPISVWLQVVNSMASNVSSTSLSVTCSSLRDRPENWPSMARSSSSET